MQKWDIECKDLIFYNYVLAVNAINMAFVETFARLKIHVFKIHVSMKEFVLRNVLM